MDPTTPPPETATETPPQKPRIKRYILVDAATPDELVATVEAERQKGYLPCGGVAIFSFCAGHVRYTQAMTLPTPRVHPLMRFWRGFKVLVKRFWHGLGKLAKAALEDDGCGYGL